MSRIRQNLSDIHILGEETESRLVRADRSDRRKFLRGTPICPLLAQHNILHAGIMVARPPFEVVRTDQSGTFFLACFAGSGSILSDGEWKTVGAGHACLLPPHTVNALKVARSRSWSFVWVRYFEPHGVVPVATAHSPTRGDYEGEPMRKAIEGLLAEASGKTESAAIQHHWVELINSYVLRFATPRQTDDRVWRAWERVESNLGADWSLSSMAQEASMSGEHFRRLCLKALGRSPVKHLTFLRMHRAAELLTTTKDKVETIARALGYENPFAFSNTFLKWIGVRPSEHRADGQTDVEES